MRIINELHRTTLITAQEVVRVCGKSKGLDLTRIRPNIIVAEERFIRDILGSGLYDSLRAAKNVEITSDNIVAQQALMVPETDPDGNTFTPQLVVGDVVNSIDFLNTAQKLFWRDHLWQIVAECVMYVSFPDNFMDFTSSGLVHNAPTFDAFAGANGGNTTTPGLKSLAFQMDKMLSGRINALVSGLHEHLCLYRSDFALYNKPCKCDEQTGYTGSVAQFIDLYDDGPDKSCCDGYSVIDHNLLP